MEEFLAQGVKAVEHFISKGGESAGNDFNQKHSPMRCGILGLPNAGKSTLFQALTMQKVAVENYPFCTIEPNVGVVQVPDTKN